MALYLLRHGQTDMNVERRMQGRSDIELNDEGRSQAKGLAKEIEKLNLNPQIIYSSPLKRARDTAKIALGVEEDDLVIADELIEISFGPYELMERYSLPKDIEEAIFLKPGITPTPEGVESFFDLMERSSGFINMIREKYSPEDTVVCVSHGSLMQSVIMKITGTPIEEFWESFKLKNCCLLRLDLDSEDFSLRGDKIETVFEGFSLGRKVL